MRDDTTTAGLTEAERETYAKRASEFFSFHWEGISGEPVIGWYDATEDDRRLWRDFSDLFIAAYEADRRATSDRDEWRHLARRLAAAVDEAHAYGLDGYVGDMMVRLGDLIESEDFVQARAPADDHTAPVAGKER